MFCQIHPVSVNWLTLLCNVTMFYTIVNFCLQALFKIFNSRVEASQCKTLQRVQQHSSADRFGTNPSSNKYSMWNGVLPYEADQDRCKKQTLRASSIKQHTRSSYTHLLLDSLIPLLLWNIGCSSNPGDQEVVDQINLAEGFVACMQSQ